MLLTYTYKNILCEKIKTKQITMLMKNPSDFCIFPWESKAQDSNSERVALNIMVILERTGNSFRELKWDEYKTEREKNGNFSHREKEHFDKVINYCTCANKAVTFSKSWAI
jgi:hypothetical protein